MKRDTKVALLLWLVASVLFGATAGRRLLFRSTDTHFVYQAECFLAKRLDLDGPPPHKNDWAEVETLKMRSGQTLKGQFLRQNPNRFRTLSGRTETVDFSQIAERSRQYYVSFPPFPSLLMLPFVALFHHRTNDVLFSVLVAGISPALLFLLLRRLPRQSDEQDNEPLDLWLTLLFGLGSVFYFSAVQGQVWYTAHVVASALCVLLLLCLWPLRPWACGFLCGALFLTRPQMASVGLLFLFQLFSKPTGESSASAMLRRIWPNMIRFAIPAGILFGFGLIMNYIRFEKPFEFGHSYLQTIQADNIQRFGLMNYHFLSRNLATALSLLPKILPNYPYVQISSHGLALWLTSPALLFLLWPERPLWSISVGASEEKERIRKLRLALWATVLPIALASLFYQNTGFIQFGYRFSIDYLPFLIVLLRLGSPKLSSSWLFRAAVVWGVLVNLFGAITFNRIPAFYFTGFFSVPISG